MLQNFGTYLNFLFELTLAGGGRGPPGFHQACTEAQAPARPLLTPRVGWTPHYCQQRWESQVCLVTRGFHWYTSPTSRGVGVPHYCPHVAPTDNTADGVVASLPLTMVKALTPPGGGTCFLSGGVEVRAPHVVSSDT